MLQFDRNGKQLFGVFLTLEYFQGLVDVLLGLELVVEDELYCAILVEDIGLSSRQRTEEVAWNSPGFSQLIAFVAEKGERQSVLLLECLSGHETASR